MPEVHISPTPSAASAADDQAFSRGLLDRVAAGELDAALRIWTPSPALALRRLDALRPGAAAARELGARARFEPIERISGGHAVVLGPGSVCVGLCEPAPTFEQTQERYERMVRALLAMFAGLGIDAERGELPGEWCPGAWSIRSGTVKLAGLAQRAIKGAAWIDAVIALAPDEAGRSLLVEVYAALELPLDPATVGSVREASGRDVSFDDVAQPLVAALGN